MQFGRARREEPDVNLTPLIDVVFLLLIFFMVSTTFSKESEIAIELPTADGEVAPAEARTVEILIDASGRFFVNKQEVINTRVDTLKRAIAKEAGDDPEPRILLSADRQTPHQAVITAMDAARRLGFSHLTFSTTRPLEP